MRRCVQRRSGPSRIFVRYPGTKVGNAQGPTQKATIERLLAFADVRLDGDRPWDIHIHNDRLFAKVLAAGSLALGESYMDGWWDCERLGEFFCRILQSRLDAQVKSSAGGFEFLKAKLINLQAPSRAFVIGKHHYDIGNDLYQCMLGERLHHSARAVSDWTPSKVDRTDYGPPCGHQRPARRER